MRVATSAVVYILLVHVAANADQAPSGPGAVLQEVVSPPTAEELRQIQQSLGGSAVEQFPSLRAERRGPTPLEASSRRAVEALRESASQLDAAANRLETLDLYRQADALRAQAQRLRLDARGMLRGEPTLSDTPPSQRDARPLDDSSVTPRNWQSEPREPPAVAPLPIEPTPAPE